MTTAVEPVNLKAELARRGLTQREVARQMGITHTYLSRLVSRKQPFSKPLAILFSQATGISVDG